MTARTTFASLSAEAVTSVAGLFAAPATVEPYSPDGGPVYRIRPGGAADGISIVLWTSLQRVDVTSAGNHGWVMKAVGSVTIIEGVEVVFRPVEGRGFLFVSVNGWVNMVVG